MGPLLQPELNPNISIMEPEHRSKTSSNPSKQLSSSSLSSSSSSSSNRDFFELDTNDISNSRRVGATTLHKPSKDSQLASNSGDEEFQSSSMPGHDQTNRSTTQSPPMQVMERADDFAGMDPNRIPLHVFDRSKSSAPEWSVCSNESLFSIHMGNMSFTRDHVNWIGKSGDLGYPGEYKSGELGYIGQYPPPPPPRRSIDFSSNQPPSTQSTELGKSGNLNQGLGATEATAAETMREVIRENAASDPRHNPEKLSPQKIEARPRSPHRHSDESIKSFAFPILTGDVDQSDSLSVDKDKHRKQPASQPQSPKTTPSPPPPQQQHQQPQSETQTPKPQTAKSQAPKEGLQNGGGQVRWFSCLSCCSFCS